MRRVPFMLLIAALTACSPTHVPAKNPLPTAPPDLQRFYSQTVDWGSCAGYRHPDEPLAQGLECARINVPLDYAHPDGTAIHLALSRKEATGHRTGAIVVNPGGPGASGLGTAASVGNTALGRNFDVIGFDPRGVGASEPEVLCDSPADVDADRKDDNVDHTQAGIDHTETQEHQYVDRCLAKSGTALLQHVGTSDVAADLDVIRGVLGEAKLTFLGYSYGTKLGAEYLAKYPDRVRAMVLDGGVRLDSDPIEDVKAQLAGFQGMFNRFAADCATRVDCPLGPDPSRAVARYQDLTRPLIKHPAPTGDGRGLSYSDAMTGTQQALYTPELWKALEQGLTELTVGRGDSLLRLADIYDGRRSDGSYSNMNDAFTAVRCADDKTITDRGIVGRSDAEFRAAAPFLDDGGATGQAPLDVCAFWPVKFDHSHDPTSASGGPKVVVVSTTGDPATPYADGVALAKQLGASLITYNGAQHTVALNSDVSCVDDAVLSYLIDLVSPPDGLTC